jgi:orotidine-5'-phosphate decarboxylase
MQDISDKLIVALDVKTLDEAKRFVDMLYPTVKRFKVGNQLFTACGPAAVAMIGEKGAKVFLDLKFYDIPNTVYFATHSGTSSSVVYIEEKNGIKNVVMAPVFMMTVHIVGGRKMLEEAARSAKETSEELKIPKPFIVGVTRLTSEEANEHTQKDVLDAARLAKDSGLDGVVCSVHEAAAVRKACGKDFIIVTPGIRPKDTHRGDQKRVATAEEALKAGADFIVVGRPVLEANDPLAAAKDLLRTT